MLISSCVFTLTDAVYLLMALITDNRSMQTGPVAGGGVVAFVFAAL